MSVPAAPVAAHSRRRLLALGAGAAAGVASGMMTGCASGSAGSGTAEGPALPREQRPLSRGPFVAPRVSADRVLRVVVGLRPYRPSGFVVRRDEIDGKQIIHNYGHGGGGISLSWGSSALAVREALALREALAVGEAPALSAGQTGARPMEDAAVIGGGIMGLTSARLLQDAGWRVTIYTRDMLQHATSSIAGGQWTPTSVFEEGLASPEFEARYQWAARVSHHAFQSLAGAGYGVRYIENYYLGDRPMEVPYYLRALPDLYTSVADLAPGEHPFPVDYVRRTVTMLIEPAQFLRQVRNDFLSAGGRFVIRDFKSLSQVLALSEPVIFNCTGLGARALFGDTELIPARGQLVFLPPDPAVDFLTVGGGRDVSYMFPRRGEIILGGSFEENDWSLEPDPAITERIVEDHRRLFDAMG